MIAVFAFAVGVFGDARGTEGPIYDIDIPATNAADALNRLAEQTGALMLFPYDLVSGRQTNTVRGRHTLPQALERLLQGTGLSGGLSNKRVVRISAVEDARRAGEDDSMASRGNSKIGRFAAFLASLAAASTASSQVTEPIEEVIVTVRKRSESLQDVPIAVSAFTAADIARRSMQELEDIAAQTTGFNFEAGANGGFGLPTIRGAAQFNSTLLETNVSVFMDGLYIPRQYAFDQSLINTARVEIAKGPQNALHGRNAFMGAINYVPRKAPLEEAEFSASATLGSDEREDYEISIGVPVVRERLAFRVSAGQSDFDGTWDNPHPNANLGTKPGTNGKLGGWDRKSLSIGVLVNPTDALRLDLAYYDSEDFNEEQPRYRIDRRNNGTRDELNCGVFNGNPPLHRLWCGELPLLTDRLSKDPRGYGIVSETEITRLGAGWDISDALAIDYVFGNVASVVHTTSVSVATDPLTEDNSRAGVNTSMSTPNGDFDYDSHELRLAYDPEGAWSGLAGAYYSEGTDTDFAVFGTYPLFNAPGGTAPVPFHDVVSNRAQLSSYETTTTDVWAVFVSLTYAGFLDGKGRLTIEGRYNDEEKSLFNHLVNPAANPALAPGQLLSDQYKYFTPRATFDVAVGDAHMVYASVAKGVLGGGFNGAPGVFLDRGFLLVESERTFDTSSNWTYEVGSKSTLLDGRAQANAAAYFVDWSNVQMSRRPTIVPALDAQLTAANRDRISQITSNLGDARIYGIEFDGTLQVTHNLRLNAGASYQDSRYKDGTISDRIVQAAACDGVVCATNGDVGGNTLQRQSPLQAFAGVFWEHGIDLGALGDETSYYLRADVTYQSKQYSDEINTAWVEPRTLVNVSAGLADRNWELQFWVKNLTAEEYVNQSGAVFQSIDVGYTPTFGKRRTLGATFKVNF